jgi:transposase
MVAARQAVPFRFTPTYRSWMNLVERWFSVLTKNLQRSAHRKVKELAADIKA